ncbi:MAG: AAA family ATPase [Gammaproteobacteria bacterium]
MKMFPPFRLDTTNQCLWRLGDRGAAERVLMTPKAFAVLEYLVDRAGRLVTHDELLNAVWTGAVVEPQAVKKHILSVRSALGDRPKMSAFIETVPKRGYRFIAPVSELSASYPAASARTARGILVGRGASIEELRHLWQLASGGARQIVFITGEPGIGKTALAAEFRYQLAAEERVLRIAHGQCIEGYGSKEPYGPMLDALGGLCRGPQAEPIVRALVEEAPTWLAQLPGVIRPEHRSMLQRELLGATRERMLREICEAMESISAQIPLLLVLEDLQWADASTVDLISALARRRAPAKLLLLASSRPLDAEPPGYPLKVLMRELVIHRLCHELKPTALREADVEEYLNAQSPANLAPPGLSALVHRHSEGNPLFMVAALEHMNKRNLLTIADGRWQLHVPLDEIELAVPDDLRLMIEAQLERLSVHERTVLELASVAGATFSATLVGYALGADPHGVENLFEGLSRLHHVVRWVASRTFPDGSVMESYEFTHALYRQVLYERQLPGRRATLHRLIGERLAAIYATRIEDVAPELAYHFEQAADWSRSVEYLRLAAEIADRRLAPQHAVSLLSRALELANKLPERQRASTEAALLTALAADRMAAFDPYALETYETLAARAAQFGLIDVQAHALIDLSFYLSLYSAERSLDAASRALSLSDKQEPAERIHTRAACAFRRLLLSGWNADDAREFTAVHGEEGASVPTRRSDWVEVSLFRWLSGRYRDGLRLALEFRARVFEAAETPNLADFEQVSAAIATNRLFLGEWGDALDGLSVEMDRARRNDSSQRMYWVPILRAWVHLHALDFKGVLEICLPFAPLLRALEGTGTSELPAAVSLAQLHIAMICRGSAAAALGDSTQALEDLSNASRDMDRNIVLFDWYWRMQLEAALTQVWLAKGDLASADAAAKRLLERALTTADRTWQAIAWDVNARVALANGDQDRAMEYISNGVSTVQGVEVPLAAWQVHATATDIFERSGHRESATSHRDAGRDTILRLADSLGEHESLRETFLSAPRVAWLLSRKETAAAIAATTGPQ